MVPNSEATPTTMGATTWESETAHAVATWAAVLPVARLTRLGHARSIHLPRSLSPDMKFSVDSALGERLPWGREPMQQLSPAGQHDASVPALSRIGSHLLRSDGGAGFPSFSCRKLKLPLRPITLRRRQTGETKLHARSAHQAGVKKSCPALEHKQGGMGKRLRSGPEMRVRVLNGQVSQRLLQNCVLRVRGEKLSRSQHLATGAFCPNPEP